MKRKTMFICIGLLLGVLAFWGTIRLLATDCNCYDSYELLCACYDGEYVDAVMEPGHCDYNLCQMRIHVTCRDQTDNIEYTNTITSMSPCSACDGGSGGGWWEEPIWW